MRKLALIIVFSLLIAIPSYADITIISRTYQPGTPGLEPGGYLVTYEIDGDVGEWLIEGALSDTDQKALDFLNARYQHAMENAEAARIARWKQEYQQTIADLRLIQETDFNNWNKANQAIHSMAEIQERLLKVLKKEMWDRP